MEAGFPPVLRLKLLVGKLSFKNLHGDICLLIRDFNLAASKRKADWTWSFQGSFTSLYDWKNI